MLHAEAKKAPSRTVADVGLIDQPNIRQVVIGPDNLEYLLIRTSMGSMTLQLTGHRASRAPVRLTFQVPAQPGVEAAANRLARYPKLMVTRSRWKKRTRSQVLMRDALVAVDGREAGASHREVAEAILGHRRVREEWSSRGGWLKERMRRALDAGQALCEGGHWKYVERACLFGP